MAQHFIFVGKDNTLLSSIHFPSVVMVWFSLIIRNNSCVGEKQSESYNKCEIKKAFCFRDICLLQQSKGLFDKTYTF